MRLLCYIALVLLLLGCERELDLDIPQDDGTLVIDGFIENGQFATVTLTYNSPFLNDLDSADIVDLIIRNATVRITDGTEEEVLTLFRRNEFFPPFVYQTTDMKGEIGKTYTITVTSQGRDYTASSTLSAPKEIDRIWFEPREEGDTLGFLLVEITDDPLTEDYYRFYTQRVGRDSTFIPSLNYGALADTRLEKDGPTSLTIHKGISDYLNPFGDIFFRQGDTLFVKMCTMDRSNYQVWLSIQDELVNYANPFAESSANVNTNVQGGGLGVFSAFGAKTYKVTLK